MYITPNSTVILCKEIPFNNNYEATLWFGDETAQLNYFIGKKTHTFSKMSYVRPSGVRGGAIDVKELADNLYNVNYMCFQNSNFGGKWFYAFVNFVEYINNKTARIHFQIDELQTWMFDYSLNQCFVEREHVADDVIGGHIVDEGLELGEYVYIDFGTVNGFKNGYKIVVASSFDSVEETADEGWVRNVGEGGIYGGVYSGLQYKLFDDADSINRWLADVTSANYQDGIVSIFMIPTDFIIGRGTEQPKTITTTYKKADWFKPYLYKLNGETFEIKPKNNKLYAFPYNMLCITDQNGNIGNYRLEYFSSPDMTFHTTLAMSGSPECQIAPENYRNIDGVDYMDRMTLANFPMCAYAIDSYRAWVAQNSIPMTVSTATGATQAGISKGVSGALKGASVGNKLADKILGENNLLGDVIGTVGGALAGFFGGGALGAIESAFPQVADNLSQQYIASTLPPQAKGSQTSIINMATGTQGFRCYRAHIHPTYLKLIDDYFTKYGYAIKRVKIPNTHVRKNWTYVKTVGCTITASCPADSERVITQIYDKGITFFTNEEAIKQQNTMENPVLDETALAMEVSVYSEQETGQI